MLPAGSKGLYRCVLQPPDSNMMLKWNPSLAGIAISLLTFSPAWAVRIQVRSYKDKFLFHAVQMFSQFTTTPPKTVIWKDINQDRTVAEPFFQALWFDEGPDSNRTSHLIKVRQQ